MTWRETAVVVMSKYPTPGRVKTRLVPDLSREQAAAVHRECFLHLIRRLIALAPGALVVCHDPPDAEPDFRSLFKSNQINAAKLQYLPQSPGDLGARLAAAYIALAASHPTILFLGVDSPDVPDASLTDAANILVRHPVSLGPCDDGGYWCLGLRRDLDVKRMLDRIDWSTGREAEQTLQRARDLGYTPGLADAWTDVDRYDDLIKLLRRLEHDRTGQHTMLAEALGRIL